MRVNIKTKLQTLRQYTRYGEIKELAEKNNIEKSRAYEILRGRLMPKDHELDFVNDVITRVLPRQQQLQRLGQV